MEQHPIPQQISSYQFKLVGDMTLKQFFQVAGGALVGLLFYSTGLNGLIKWPLILISVGLGAAMAFLPFEERPLEKWIIAFFRSIYSPTIYTWKKSEKTPVYFSQDTIAPSDIKNVSQEYLSTLPQTNANKKLETAESTFLSKLMSLITLQSPTSPVKTAVTQTPATTNQTVVNTTTVVKPAINIPVQQSTPITRSIPKFIVEEKPKPIDKSVEVVAQEVGAGQTGTQQISSKTVQFSIDAAPPNPPTIANTITGQVIDAERKIIPGAIMEIRDSNGRPVRALRSNLAGHFIIVTPLFNGKYEIKTEKEGFKFDSVSFEANGQIIPPIAIKGTKSEGVTNG